jgi:Fe-S cluster assembly protein SufD
LVKDTPTVAAPDKGADIESKIAGQAVFADSQLVALDQRREWKERGVVLMGLEEALGRREALLRPILREDLDSIDNRFQAWHFSLLGPGLFLYIPPFVEIQEPFIFEFNESDQEHLSSLRVVVVLDRGARARVIQKTVGTGEQEMLCNSGMDIRLGESAGLDIYRLQGLNEHSLCISHDVASLSRDSSLRCFDAFFGGRLLKSRLECNLEDRGCEANLQGIYFARHQQHMDIRSIQRHRAPQTNSRAFYKGAISDAGRAVYQGLIEVSPLAAKTDAYLTNKNLILNDGARADSIPSLKINTNDVKCSHGSTTGRISDEEVFYLMSRGLARSEAEGMLIQGYFEELSEGVPEALRDHLHRIIQSRLEERD